MKYYSLELRLSFSCIQKRAANHIMSILVPIISDIITSIDEIDTVVESFQKGYIDNVGLMYLYLLNRLRKSNQF